MKNNNRLGLLNQKEGFTLIELLGVVVLIAIIGGLVALSASGVIGIGKSGAYKTNEKTLVLAAQNYLTDYPDEEPLENSLKNIYLKDLILSGYISEIKDPNGGNCNVESNNSYVTVFRQDHYPISTKKNYKFNYRACLICLKGDSPTYISKECVNSDEVVDDIVFTIESNKIYLKTTAATSLTYKGKFKTINYTSSDTSVATVDNNGVITANKLGTATITAVLIDSEGITTRKMIAIEVVKLPAIYVKYTPPEGIKCKNGVNCENVQLMLDKLAEIFTSK